MAHTAPFPFVARCAARGPRDLAHAARRRLPPTIYLTYDDGPNPTATPALLDVLAAEGVRATFFLIERHLTAETEPIVRRIAAEGHGIALHSHTRAKMFLEPDELGAV